MLANYSIVICVDFGIEVLADLVKKTDCPWLMSNVIDNETGAPLGDGQVTWIIENQGKKIGLVNLLDNLPIATPCNIHYGDWM